jgi:ATP/maltotriose-dependent transcriptional regulator MalT
VPHMRLDRLRALDQVLELGPTDLAFDSDEMRAFFAHRRLQRRAAGRDR